MTRYILAAIIAVSLIVARTAAAEEDLAVHSPIRTRKS